MFSIGRKQILATSISVVLLACAILLVAWTGEESTQPVAQNAQAARAGKLVLVKQVQLVDGRRNVRFPGVTRAARRASLSFIAPARLASRSVEVGERVKAGQVLATLDDREFKNAVRSAEAAMAELEVRLSQAERDLSRVERLSEVRAATPEELEKVRALAESLAAARDAALLQLQEARRLLGESQLRAPFAGVVTGLLVEPGEWAMPGQPVVELSGDGALEIEVMVPEQIATGLDTGQEAGVELPFLGRHLTGRLTSVTRAALGPGRLFPVVLELDQNQCAGIGAGMTAEVLLEVNAPAELAVPMVAVLNPGSSRPSVFCVRQSKAVEVPVELGQLHGDLVAVQAALEPGEPVVVAGHTALIDGDAVELPPAAAATPAAPPTTAPVTS